MATASSVGTGLAARDDGKANDSIKAFLAKGSDRIAAVLPAFMPVDKQIQVVATMAYSNPYLAKCDKGSILTAMVRAGSYGLNLDPAAQEAFLIPRWDRDRNGYVCHFQMGYQGLRRLVMQSGEIVLIETAVVYATDRLVYRQTDRALEFVHEPGDPFADPETRGEVRGYYSLATFRNGLRSVEMMGRAAVDKIRRDALAAITRPGKTPPKTPWDNFYDEMGRKTVLKRHSKSLPRNTQRDQAVFDDDAIYDRIAARVQAAFPAGIPTRGVAALEARLAAPEPSFSASQGVARPLRSEAEDDDYPAAPADEDETPRMREPGED